MKITSETPLLELACLVCEALRREGIQSFLSGGAVVTIYSKNEYESYDLDFISHGDFTKIAKVMSSLGFTREKGRHFVHPASRYFVEFPGVAAAIGDQPIREFKQIRTDAGVLRLLTPTHCVMDRLSGYYHWKDEQSLEQALLVAKQMPVSLDKIRKWSIREGMGSKFTEFMERMKKQVSQESPGSSKKIHPWRLCSAGEHWVTTHPLRVPPNKSHPAGSTTTRRGHCARNPSGKDQLYPDEIQEIAKSNFLKLQSKLCPDDLGYHGVGSAYDALISGWVQYWNEVFSPTPPLDPNLVKALIATESSFEAKELANRKNPNSARGLMQITNDTRKILADEKGELKDHFITATKAQLNDPNINICAGVRWLFVKRKLAGSKFGRVATWEEAVAEYKGVSNGLAKGLSQSEKIMKRFQEKLERLTKCAMH